MGRPTGLRLMVILDRVFWRMSIADFVAWDVKDARDGLWREEGSVPSTTVARFVLLDERPAARKLLIVIGLNPGRLGRRIARRDREGLRAGGVAGSGVSS